MLDLKERTGLSPTTIERYRSMLPRIFDGIGHLKVGDIRPFHLNDFYKHLAENGVRNKGAIATAKRVVKRKVSALKWPKHKIAEEAGFSHTTLNAILKGDAVKYDNAEKLAKLLGYSVCELFSVEDKFKPLSEKTIQEHHRLISMILAQADKELLIPYNPAAKATPPKVRKKEANYFQPEEVADILKALEDAPIKWKTMTYILIANGVDPVTTANELGHADANTTQAIYAHQIARARAEAAGVRAGVFSMLREA